MSTTPQYRIEEYLAAIRAAWLGETPLPSYPAEPAWRIEKFLAAILSAVKGDSPVLACPEPVWHIEEFARAIYDALVGASPAWPCPTATNNIEAILLAIYNVVADGTETDGIMTSWDIEKWLMDSYDAAKEGGGIEKTVSGTMVHITDALAKAALSVLASIEPIQDLHGYSSPWPAGGGKNKLPNAAEETQTNAGVTVKSLGDGQYTINGTDISGSTNLFIFDLVQQFTAANTQKLVIGGNWIGTISFLASEGVRIDYWSKGSSSERVVTSLGNLVWNSVAKIRFDLVANSAHNNETAFLMLVDSSVTDTSFAPFSNICPISGRTGLSVYVSPTQDPDDATVYNAVWSTQAGTVYGGTLDVVTGVLTVDRVMFNADNTIECLLSSQTSDVAVFDAPLANNNMPNHATTPSVISNRFSTAIESGKAGRIVMTGQHLYFVIAKSQLSSYDKEGARAWLNDNPSQFLYKIATPLAYQLTAQEVQMLLGENNIWASSGDTVSVTYYAEGNANPLQSLNILLGGNYSNPKTADDVSDKEALEIILGGNK